MSSVDKIESGLASYEAARQGRPPAIVAARGAPVTKAALAELCAATRRKRTAHRKLRESVAAHMERWRQERERVLASLSPKARAEIIAAEEPAERAMALKISAEARGKHLADIHSAYTLSQATARLFSDSVAYLDSMTLGSGKRSVYDRQLSNAGAAALADAMLRAAATGDADLFAAANAKAGALPKGQKDTLATRIGVRDTADLLATADLAEARGVMSALAYFAAEATYESAKLEGFATNAQDRIGVGVLRRDVPEELLKEPADDPAAIIPAADPSFAAPRGTFAA